MASEETGRWPAYGEGKYGVNIVTRTTTVTATLEEEGEMTVQVVDDTGSGVTEAAVGIEAADEAFTDNGSTDSNGEVVFGGIPIDAYTVTVSKTGYFETTVDVAEADFT